MKNSLETMTVKELETEKEKQKNFTERINLITTELKKR